MTFDSTGRSVVSSLLTVLASSIFEFCGASVCWGSEVLYAMSLWGCLSQFLRMHVGFLLCSLLYPNTPAPGHGARGRDSPLPLQIRH
ncbi:hypothetical protein EDD15DRAFT_1542550 [Pisolithus albus]|nr:hypothetical protein EDD15DRAFT_1542550 [Pisolithus albus]